MINYYKYKWNKNNEKMIKFERNRKGVIYKEIIYSGIIYIIIKYISKDVDSHKTNSIKYKVKVWTDGRYKPLKLCNNPRQAINYIKKHSKQVKYVYY